MTGPGWPNERGWLVIVTTGLLASVLGLIAYNPALAESQLFVAIASGVVGSSFLGVVGMWTNATKAGSELAAKALDNAGRRSTDVTQADTVNVTADTANVDTRP